MNLSGRTINNRYRIHEKIREGVLGESYHAEDLAAGSAPRTFAIFNGDAASRRIEDIIRFKSDVKKLAGLRHGNCAAVFETGSLLDYSYLVSEHVAGPSLAETIASGERPAYPELLGIALGLARGLAFLHANGIVLRNLGPENIAAAGAGAVILHPGTSHLCDYGRTAGTPRAVGLIEHLAPEQCGMAGRSADERSDLFSLGALLYHLATGTSPFRGSDACSTLYRVITDSPDFAPVASTGAPGAFLDVMRNLMEKEPDRRYQTARGLLSDLESLERGDTAFASGAGDLGRVPHFHTGMVGRERELEELKAVHLAAVEGAGSLCLVAGEAGAGKTRLAEELGNAVFARGGIVLYCKCNEGYDASPCGAVVELLDSFMKTYNSLSDEERRSMGGLMTREFRGLGAILVGLNPALSAIFGNPGSPSSLEEKSESARFHGVTAQFFLRLAEIRPGLVIAVDDLQWCDEGSLAILDEILGGLAGVPSQLLLTARSESDAGRDRLRAFREKSSALGVPCLDLEVTPFDEAGTGILVSKLLHAEAGDAADVASYLHARAGGNVFFTIGLLRKLSGDDILRRGERGWVLDRDRADALDASDALLETVLSRIRLLGSEEARVLSCAAALGREFGLAALLPLTSLDSGAVVSVIDRAVDYQILRTFPGERNTYVFFHDRIKEILYGNMSPEERKSVHLAIARALEKSGAQSSFELARHFLLAGADDDFLVHALPAARTARERFAYEDAEKMLLKILALLDSPDDPRRIAAKMELGGVYLVTGNFTGAVDSLNEILPLLKNPETRAGVLALKSEAHYRLNEWDACVGAAHDGLSLLGERFPHGRTALVSGSFREIVRFFLSFPYRRINPGVKKTRSGDRRIIGLYRVLLEFYMFRNLGLEFLYSSFRMAVISQSRIGPSKELSISLIGVGLIFSALAFFKTAHGLISRALRISLEAGDRWGEAYSYGFKGLNDEFMGNYERSIGRGYRESMKTFTEIGDIKNIGIIHMGLFQSYYFLSDYGNALTHNGESYRIARKINDEYFTGMALVYFSRLCRETGDLEEAGRYAAMALDYNHGKSLWQNLCAAFIEQGCLCLERRDPGAAIGHLEKARELYERGYFSPQHTVHVYAHLAEAYIAEFAVRGRSMTRGERKRYLRNIQRLSRMAEKLGRKWVSHHGKALRVRGTLNMIQGKSRRAENCFLKSIDRCGSLGNRHELARAYYDYGLFLMQERRAVESRECIESAYEIFREIGSRRQVETTGRLLGIGVEGCGDTMGSLITRERESALQEMSKNITGSGYGSLDLRRVICRLFEYFGAGQGCLFARDAAEPDLTAVFSKPGDDPRLISALRRGAGRALDAREQTIGDNYRQGDRNDSTPDEDGAVHLPLGAGGEIYGVCSLMEPRFIGAIQEGEMALIRDILSHAILLMARSGDAPPVKAKEGGDITSSLTDSAVEKMEKALSYIGDNYRSDISRDGLAAHLGMSPNYFGKLFRDYTGQKMNDYINDLRIDEAMRLLRANNDMITDIAFSAGFDNLRTFNRAFQKKTRMTPLRYRESVKK